MMMNLREPLRNLKSLNTIQRRDLWVRI